MRGIIFGFLREVSRTAILVGASRPVVGRSKDAPRWEGES